MVSTQIRLLASCQATRSTLIATVAKWLGFLGVRSQVNHLEAGADQKIRICLTVDKPEGCENHDWQQILQNLNQGTTDNLNQEHPQPQLTSQQQSKLQRLLAYLIQVAEPEVKVNWDVWSAQLERLGLDEQMLLGIRSALKVPQSLDLLLEGFDPDLAAIALPLAVSIAIVDRQINSSEDSVLTALLQAIKQPAKV